MSSVPFALENKTPLYSELNHAGLLMRGRGHQRENVKRKDKVNKDIEL